MSNYEKQNFVSGQILKADHLNHMENQIEFLSDDTRACKKYIIIDGTVVSPTNYQWYFDLEELVDNIRGAGIVPIITLMVMPMTQAPVKTIFCTEWSLINENNSFKVQLKFNGKPDLLVDPAAGTITPITET